MLHGPNKEVMFRQRHEPGRQGVSDFTELKGVLITLRGEPLSHRLYPFRLAYSGWSDMKVTLGGESYTALGAYWLAARPTRYRYKPSGSTP